MSSEPFQIEIPSFDEDEDYSNVITPMPHGHHKPFFDPNSPVPPSAGFQPPPPSSSSFSASGWPTTSGAGGGLGGGGDDSPSGPISHFVARQTQGHARGESTSSETSILSLSTSRSLRRPGQGHGHAPTSSVATSSTAPTSSGGHHTPTRKTSFGALRAAMKSVRAFAEAAEKVPPVPSLNLSRERDRERTAGAGEKDSPYPELKNPFGFSKTPTKEGGSAQQQQQRAQSPAQSIKSSMKKRPSIPNLGGSRSGRPSASGRNPSSASAGVGGAMAGGHSAASSWAYESDFSDSHTHTSRTRPPPGRGSAVPPVPKLPRSVAARPTGVGVDEALGLGAAVVESEREPSTPGELALHVVFTQFVARVEEKIRGVLDVTLDKDPHLVPLFGWKSDPALDTLLQSLGHIATRHAQSVVEALMRWRKTQREPVSGDVLVKAMGQGKGRSEREARGVLERRKHLASIYVFSRALLVLIRTVGKDSISEPLRQHLETTIFTEYRELDPRLLSSSQNWKSIASLYAEVLGAMADTRFQSVTDHFLDAFSSLSSELQGQGEKEAEQRYTHLLRGLRYVKLRVWPPEAFEEAAEFLDALSSHFASAHGQIVKSAFSDSLAQLLHPMRASAGAEVNHPLWSKAIQAIYPRAFAMMAKPRYWPTALPLTVTALCLAPTEFFLKHWVGCFDLCTAKLKDKSARVLALNGICRLLWTYLYRTDEPASTSLKVLEGCIRSVGPPNRPIQLTPEEPLDLFVYILQLACGRHFDYGKDLIFDFLQDPSLSSSAQNGASPVPQSPEKMTIAVRAAVLTLRGMETDHPPSWPTSSDFTLWPISDDSPAWSGTLSDQTLSKPGVREFVDRLSPLVMKLATTCDRLVGGMFVSDDSYSYSHQAPSYEEREYLVVRQNGSRMVAYRKDLVPAMDLLKACYDALPMLWNRSGKLSSTLGRLIEAVAHVNPLLGQAATEALKRFVTATGDETNVVLNITRWLFASEAILQSESGVDLMCEHLPMLELWLQLVKDWAGRIVAAEGQTAKAEAVAQLVGQIEAGCLFMICSAKVQVRDMALKTLRVVAELPDAYQPEATVSGHPFRLIQALEGSIGQEEYLRESDRATNLIDDERSKKWIDREMDRNLAKLIKDDSSDRSYSWRLVFPPFLRVCLEKRPRLINSLRSTLAAAVARTHPVVSSHAGMSTKTITATMKSTTAQAAPGDSTQAATQWVLWVLALSAIAVPSEATSAVKEHNRHGSEPIPLQERIVSNRGLIRLLLPYLDATSRSLREGTVYALACIHPKSLRAVLEDTSSVIRNVHIEAHAALNQKRAMQRNREQDQLHTSVMHVFQLTADWAKKPVDDQEQLIQLMLTFFTGSLAFFRDAVSRKDHDLLSLRKYFCGFVEQVFEILHLHGPWSKAEPETLLRTYRYCEEWCDYAYPSHQSDAYVVRGLADAATRAVAAITSHPSLFANPSPPPKTHQGLRPLAYVDVFRWIEEMLPLSSVTARTSAKSALRNICHHSMSDDRMTASLMAFCLPSARDPAIAATFFDVVSESVLANPSLLPTSRLLFLCLSNLVHPDVLSRRKAFACLEALLRSHQRPNVLAGFRSAVEVIPEGTHIQAQRGIARALATALPEQSSAFLAECSSRFSQGYNDGGNSMLIMLEPWMEHINLVIPEADDISSATRTLTHLLSISAVHLLGSYADEVRALWQQLACGRYPGNHRAIIQMCIKHAMRCGREDFIRIVQAGISAFSMTPIAVDAFTFLCDWIAVQTIVVSRLDDPLANVVDTPSELDSLFPPSEDTVKMSSGQAACLLLSDLALTDASILAPRLPLLLTALLTLVDHEQALIRIDAHMLLLRVLRLCSPGSEAPTPTAVALHDIDQLLRNDGAHFAWISDSARSHPEPRQLIAALCEGIMKLLGAALPTLRHDWVAIAIDWSVQTSSRHVAVRSAQMLCMLGLDLDYRSLSMMLGRLSNIISDNLDQGNPVANEIIRGLVSLSTSVTLRGLLDHPHLLWTGIVCLYSTCKHEFRRGLEILSHLFRLLEDAPVSDLFTCLNARPEGLTGPNLTLFQLLSPGLRSSTTSETTFQLLDQLSKSAVSPFFEGDDLHRVITVSMPRFLESMNRTTPHDEQVKAYALRLSEIAEAVEWTGMVRVLTSFAKDRFRTQDDFIRQMIGCLRDRVPLGGWLETVTLLLGLVFNSHTETRINTMAILKQLFSMPDIRSQLHQFGSEHLTPLLRLLNTELASQALEVLDEPMSMKGGMPARQVVRMSLINGPIMRKQDERPSGAVFGVPDASGWCVPQPENARAICRQNITALYDVCNTLWIDTARKSGIDLMGQDKISDPAHYGRPESVSGFNDDDEDALGDLLYTLYDLSNYFEEDVDADQTLPSSSSLDSMRDAESRVAAILSRSIHPANLDTTPTASADGKPPYGGELADPPTPFLDLFRMASPMEAGPSGFDQQYDSDNEGYFASLPSRNFSHHASSSWESDVQSVSDTSSVYGPEDGYDNSHYHTRK